MAVLSKICSCCRDNKEISGFSRNRSNKDGYDHYCKECKSNVLKLNKKKINERRIAYRHEKGISTRYGSGRPKSSTCKLRISKTGKAYTNDWEIVRKIIYERDNWTCQICGIKCRGDGKDKIQCHHINDNSLDNDSYNLITLCASCHMRLHKSVSDKWRELVRAKTKKVI